MTGRAARGRGQGSVNSTVYRLSSAPQALSCGAVTLEAGSLHLKREGVGGGELEENQQQLR